MKKGDRTPMGLNIESSSHAEGVRFVVWLRRSNSWIVQLLAEDLVRFDSVEDASAVASDLMSSHKNDHVTRFRSQITAEMGWIMVMIAFDHIHCLINCLVPPFYLCLILLDLILISQGEKNHRQYHVIHFQLATHICFIRISQKSLHDEATQLFSNGQ